MVSRDITSVSTGIQTCQSHTAVPETAPRQASVLPETAIQVRFPYKEENVSRGLSPS